jgi:predicted RNase H-like nuclease (RuvC/YqgF family)
MTHEEEMQMKRRFSRLRTCLLLPPIMASCGLAAVAAPEPAPSSVARPEPEAPDAKTREKLVAMERRLAAAEKTLDTVDARLGRTIQPPTPTRNFERRMEDLERRLTAIERDLKKIDAIQREQKQLDNRVRKLETKR